MTADHLPHSSHPDACGNDLCDPHVTEGDGMTGFMNGGAPPHIVREFQLAGEQGMLEIAPSQGPLLPSGLSSDVTNKSLNVGSGAAGRQQGEPSKIGMLV
ncbi:MULTISPECIES: hypothetical protein [Rhizobium/Agrobacterium group]|uniref:hypothetical protein n=1 Tax=Rhizobium/Agrobacterium group TaxID=227290 RepID=UPI001E401B93|nr:MULTISPECIES: hypothetical protein [Rhizobium/Agrobacterium group]